jgi:hypothetical protein
MSAMIQDEVELHTQAVVMSCPVGSFSPVDLMRHAKKHAYEPFLK